MKKTIKYSILGLAALCTVVLCGGYYMLGHALKPEGLITRSRNIAESYNFMFEQYPELQPRVDSLVTLPPPTPPQKQQSSYTDIQIMPCAC